MALIPPDAGIRMRMQTEANLLQPVAPVHEIPSDLPELRTGQTFSARIQEVLPDNTYKALVAGKQLTLQLPEGAKAGDELALVVIDRSPKAIIARQVEAGATPEGAGEPGAYPFAKFSPAARMIGQLLPADGEKAPAAQLNRGQPLLAQPPQSQAAAAQLAPTLAKAVSQSGMFYEAHQAQWVTGKLPLAELLQEPQGQRSAPAAFAQAAAELAAPRPPVPGESAANAESILRNLTAAAEKVGAGNTAPPAAPGAQLAQAAAPANDAAQNLARIAEKVGAGDTASHAAQAGQVASPAHQVADELRPLVQQQLDAAASQRMVWHGEVWPRQPMDWEIEWDTNRAADGSEEEAANWRTSLSLTTPRLGRVDANLQLTAAGVRIALATPYGASAADLRDAAPRLADALAAAGVPLLGFQVKHEEVAADSAAAEGT